MILNIHKLHITIYYISIVTINVMPTLCFWYKYISDPHVNYTIFSKNLFEALSVLKSYCSFTLEDEPKKISLIIYSVIN